MFRCLFQLAAVAIASAAFLAGSAAAHDPGLSSIRFRLGARSLEARLLVNDADLGTARVDAHALRVTLDGRELAPESVEPLSAPQNHSASALRYRWTDEGKRLRVVSELLLELPYGHKQIGNVEARGSAPARTQMMSRESRSIEIDLAELEPGGERGDAAAFLLLGIEHIAEGYDHLLFLLALLVSCSSLGAIARIITAFTVAHSLSLAMATLGHVTLAPGIIEPAIAASIVIVAALNLRDGARPRERFGLSFGFGLIHGLGFASVLAGLGIERANGGIAVPLVAFNLGVEAGQIALAAAVLPLFAWARRNPVLERRWAPVLSGTVGALGVVWCVERLAAL